jgi:hypothetical protein
LDGYGNVPIDEVWTVLGNHDPHGSRLRFGAVGRLYSHGLPHRLIDGGDELANYRYLLKSRKNTLIRLYDESFNWKSPKDPGPWSPDQEKEINKRVIQTIKAAIGELGPDFRVIDEFSPRFK